MIHPITGNRSRLMVWWIIWLLVGLGQSLILFFTTNCNLTASIIDGTLSALFYGLIAIAIWFPVMQLNPGRSNTGIFLLNHLILGAISVLIWLYGVKWITISLLQDSALYEVCWNNSFYYRLGAGLFIYAVVILTYYLLISIEDINKKTVREANLEKMLRETELMMLRSQINPHFLFNSLNSISSFTITNPERAREMVIKLSDFMRYALSRKEESIVALKTELENMKLYLEIEKVRFGEKLVLEESIEEASLEAKVPNMILQPLYENAIKHGVYESVGKVVIVIETYIKNRGLNIRITNDFDPKTVPLMGTGTGLQNIRRRIDLFYNKEAYLNTKKENSKFIAELYIPLTGK